MSIHTVEFSALKPPTGNPRSAIAQDTLEGLAASIRQDGVLQNLVVRPLKGKKPAYRIVTGERRYRALALLAERGEIDGSYKVPVEVRDGLSKDEHLRLATVENTQRENLPPLDEAMAFAALLRNGTALGDITAQTGLSAATIKRRLALNSLCAEGKEALAAGQITLALAEALTLGGEAAQRNILEGVQEGYDYEAAEIRDHFTSERPTLAMAIFPLESYTGTLTTDLFGEEDTTYFDDVDQFFELQAQAVGALAASHGEAAAWVEVTRDHSPRTYIYEDAEAGEPGGVVINFAPSGAVEIREGLVKAKMAPETQAQLAKKAKPKAAYATPLRRYIAHHKTLAVQHALIGNPRKAKEVALTRLLHGLAPHEAFAALAEQPEPQAAYNALEEQAASFAARLGIGAEAKKTGWARLAYARSSITSIYESVIDLSDEELDTLLVLASTMTFGQGRCEEFDTGESFFNSVAQDLQLDMRGYWRPDAAFFNARTSDQLREISRECGHAEGASSLAGYKKSELVNSLLYHFQHAHAADAPSPAQIKAREWLPPVMAFPAVVPDAQKCAEEEDLSAEASALEDEDTYEE
jgi:ParB family transcriptional regulator, chromosome partitioning protein